MNLVKQENRNVLNPGFNDIFESFFNDSFISDRMTSRVPAVNICETEDGYHIELAAPGLTKEDFKINLEKHMLNISAEKRTEQTQNDKKYDRKEYNYTSFTRSFALPDTADDENINAEYNNGILDIKVAKKETAKLESREISVK